MCWPNESRILLDGSTNLKAVIRKPHARYLFAFLLFSALLFLRRPAQLLNPQVWDEDGTQIVPGLIDHGVRSLVYPVNGYLVVLPKLISATSLAISGLHYPLVSTVLAWLVTVAVCMFIAFSPTYLKGGIVLGAATLLVPCDPEVFGIPLYTFWWASLLLFLVVLWDENSNDVKLRTSFVVIGGLSSPMIFLVAPFLIVRAAVLKGKKRELLILSAALFCCGAQAIAMFHSAEPLAKGKMSWANLGYVLPKFVGGYLAGNYIRRTNHLVWIATGVLGMFLLMAVPFIRRHPRYLYLIGLWCGTVYFIGRRVDLSVLQPRYAGPRYYFLPFVLLTWFLVSVMSESGWWKVRFFAAVLLVFSIFNMLPVRTRPQRDFEWAKHVANCTASDPYSIPVSFDGQRPWYVVVNRGQCLALQRAGLIHMSTPGP